MTKTGFPGCCWLASTSTRSTPKASVSARNSKQRVTPRCNKRPGSGSHWVTTSVSPSNPRIRPGRQASYTSPPPHSTRLRLRPPLIGKRKPHSGATAARKSSQSTRLRPENQGIARFGTARRTHCARPGRQRRHTLRACARQEMPANCHMRPAYRPPAIIETGPVSSRVIQGNPNGRIRCRMRCVAGAEAG